MHSSGDLYFLSWLTIKSAIDLISIVFIFWRLTHHSGLQGGIGKHRGDSYFLTWLVVKFVVDFAGIIYILWRLK